jgi:hypothetical protein
MAMPTVDNIDAREQRCVAVEWARQWHNGNVRCPRCTLDEFDLVDVQSEGQMRYETFRCNATACGARWKVEFRETALAVLRDDLVSEDDWIELQSLDGLQSAVCFPSGKP